MGTLFKGIAVFLSAFVVIFSLWLLVYREKVVGLPVIPQNREQVVTEFLEPIRSEGFQGLNIDFISIRSREIRIGLASTDRTIEVLDNSRVCHGVPWVREPGALLLRFDPSQKLTLQQKQGQLTGEARSEQFVLSWYLCAISQDITEDSRDVALRHLAQLESNYQGNLWQDPNISPDGQRNIGLISPLSNLSGIAPNIVLSLVWWLGLFAALNAAIFVARSRKSSSESLGCEEKPKKTNMIRHRVVASILVFVLWLAGSAVRINAAIERPYDFDEGCTLSYKSPLLNRDHDAWVHPPLFRALHRSYGEWLGWNQGDALWSLRLLSLFESILVLGLIIFVTCIFSRRLLVFLPLSVLTFSPHITDSSVLARPYSLAAFLSVICIVALWGKEGTNSLRSSPEALDWFVAILAIGLTLWTDLVAGIAVSIALLIRLVSLTSKSLLSRTSLITIIMAVCVWSLPIVPGGIHAVRNFVEPEDAGRALAEVENSRVILTNLPPDLSPDRLDSGQTSWQEASRLLGFAFLGIWGDNPWMLLFGIFFSGILIATAIHKRRLVGFLPIVLITILFILTFHLGFRVRNLLFLPYMVLFVVAILSADIIDTFRCFFGFVRTRFRPS